MASKSANLNKAIEAIDAKIAKLEHRRSELVNQAARLKHLNETHTAAADGKAMAGDTTASDEGTGVERTPVERKRAAVESERAHNISKVQGGIPTPINIPKDVLDVFKRRASQVKEGEMSVQEAFGSLPDSVVRKVQALGFDAGGLLQLLIKKE